ncbi:uncharacterized protein LOC141802631 [Halichoeres trimaculatus]|uniref:uncharacterized protein LOC141802631 n=1 Tax=Halichoeres trimaculatus TaxID=147232 RepID=UPI003D9E8E50
MKEEPPEQQEWSSSLQQEDSEPPHIKEEEEELWSSQEGEQLQGLEEAETTKTTFTPVPVKTEEEEQDCGEIREAKENQADVHSVETDPGPEVEVRMEDSSETETEDSDEWGGREPQSGPDSVDGLSDERTNMKEETLLTRGGEKLFGCSHCGRTFMNSGNLTRHVTAHTAEKPYSCPVCGKGFTKESHLTLHLTQHRGKPYSCSVCSTEWRSSSDLRNHLRVHAAQKPSSCSHCGNRYSSPPQVSRHRCVQSRDHGESEPEEDLDPGEEPDPHARPEGEFWKKSRKRQSAVTYRRKQKVSDDERRPRSKAFTFKRHAAENQQQPTDQIDLCPQNKPPTDLDPLQDQELSETGAGIHQDPSEGSYPLGETGPETGSGPEGLLMEYTETQSPESAGESSGPPQTQTRGPPKAKRLLSCPQCGGGFIQEQDLLVHMRIHIKEHLFSCSVCGQRFADRDSLSAHVSSHAVVEPFCCSVCDPGFPHSQAQCEHLRRTAQQTRFHCFCGEEFTWRRHLVRHMEAHRPGHTRSRHPGSSKGPETHQSRDQDSAEPETSDREEVWMDWGGPQSGFNPPGAERLGSDVDHVLPESHQRSGKIHRETQSLSLHQQGAPRAAEQMVPEPRVIKEEQEEVWISQAETTKSTFPPVPVKTEEEEQDPPSSQLHHRQRQQMETGADGEDCGGPGPEAPVSGGGLFWADGASERVETKSEDSVDSDFWKEGEAQRKSKSLNKDEVPRSSNKIYICFRCGGRFHVLGDLRAHERRVHRLKEKKKRTFPCSVCGHVCPYLSHLKIHMRRHTGEKPFVCQKCGKKYAQKENLRLHLLKHARESPSDTGSP